MRIAAAIVTGVNGQVSGALRGPLAALGTVMPVDLPELDLADVGAIGSNELREAMAEVRARGASPTR